MEEQLQKERRQRHLLQYRLVAFCTLFFVFETIIISLYIALSIQFMEEKVREGFWNIFIDFLSNLLIIRALFVLPFYLMALLHKINAINLVVLLIRWAIAIIFTNTLILIIFSSTTNNAGLLLVVHFVIVSLLSWLLFFVMMSIITNRLGITRFKG